MSQSIDTALVTEYSANIMLTSAQDENRLMRTVNVDMGVRGEQKYFERIGKAAFQKSTSRHGDSPLIEIEHSRRLASFEIYETGDLIDKTDTVRMMTDPTSAYVKRQAGALNRAIDTEIIEGLSRAAVTGKTGAGTATIGAANQVAVNFATTITLTKAKIIRAKEILDAFEVPGGDRFFVTNAAGLADLLNVDEVVSSDYNTVKALVQGEINTWLGFTFIRSELLQNDGSGDRINLAYQRDAFTLGIPLSLTLNVDPARSDKKFNTYIMYESVFGGVRMEEERVVEVKVTE